MNARPICCSLPYGRFNLMPRLRSTQAPFIQAVRCCLIAQLKGLQPGCIKAYASTMGKQIVNMLGELATKEVARLWRFKDYVDAMMDKMQDLEAVYTMRMIGRAKEGETGKLLGGGSPNSSLSPKTEDVLNDLDAADQHGHGLFTF
ncbi:hypothetical protein VPH35_008812 [Triticum aestivum]